MRIGWLIYGDLNTRTGGFLYDREIVRRLQAWGHQVQVVSLPWRRAWAAALGSLWARDGRGLPWDAWDVVVEDGLVHPSLSLRPPRTTTPRVALLHLPRMYTVSGGLTQWAARWLEARYLQRVQGLVAVCRANLAWARSQGFRGPAVVAYPAGDHLHPEVTEGQVVQRALRERPLQVLFVGQVVPRKGLHVLVEALTRLPRGSWRLTVVGDDRWHPAYARRVRAGLRRRGLESAVTWLGPQPPEGVARAMRRAQVLAVPSRAEGYAVVYVEAMGFGLPVIGSRVGGGPELIRPGENGYLAGPERVDEVATALRALLEPSHRARLSRAALRTYREHPTWEDAARTFETFLQTFVGPDAGGMHMLPRSSHSD